MIHRNRGNRRYVKEKKILHRMEIVQDLGFNGGSLYEKHQKKIEINGGGYMAKHGTLMHFARGSHLSIKTRDKSRYGKNESWSKRDSIKIDSMNDEFKEIFKE